MGFDVDIVLLQVVPRDVCSDYNVDASPGCCSRWMVMLSIMQML